MTTYVGPNTINPLELPINPAARPTYPSGVVSGSVWCASPAGQRGQGIQSMPDATVTERQACAAGAQPLP